MHASRDHEEHHRWCTWLTELYLDKLNALKDSTGAAELYDECVREFRDFLQQQLCVAGDYFIVCFCSADVVWITLMQETQNILNNPATLGSRCRVCLRCSYVKGKTSDV